MPSFFAATDAAAYETFMGRWSLRLAGFRLPTIGRGWLAETDESA